MKKILAALDGVSKKPTVGVNDMKRFVSIISESNVPTKEAVINSFEEDSIGGQANSFLIAADKINDTVMAEIEKIKINADAELLKDMMDKFNQFMTAYHSVGKEILQPDMFKDNIQVEGAAEDLSAIEKHPEADDPRIQRAIADKKKDLGAKEETNFDLNKSKKQVIEISRDQHAVDAVHVDVVKLARKGFDDKEIAAKLGLDADAVADWLDANYDYLTYAGDVPFEPGEEPKLEGMMQLSFKDYFTLEESKKKISAKDDPCWKGYKMVGTKKKNGKEVPNCVPGKKGD